MTAPAVVISSISKAYGPVVAVDGLTLELASGSMTALLGPSGCGKSTTLAMLAGQQRPDSGDILLDGVSIVPMPAERRSVGLVFQRPLLFPHLDVEGNVGFGLRMRHVPRAEVSRRVAEVLERLHLEHLGKRRVGELSGGQEQRVALARVLVLRPRLLLLDEPFSQLDAVLRAEMRSLVRDLHRELDLTTVFVTHDQSEAVEVADRVALMLDGRLDGHGTAREFYTAPPSLAAARFFGVTNELSGVVSNGCFRSAGLTMPTLAAAGPAILVVRPESLVLTAVSGTDVVVGTAVALRFAGTHQVLDVELPGASLVLHLPLDQSPSLGSTVGVRVPEHKCSVFPVVAP